MKFFKYSSKVYTKVDVIPYLWLFFLSYPTPLPFLFTHSLSSMISLALWHKSFPINSCHMTKLQLSKCIYVIRGDSVTQASTTKFPFDRHWPVTLLLDLGCLNIIYSILRQPSTFLLNQVKSKQKCWMVFLLVGWGVRLQTSLEGGRRII